MLAMRIVTSGPIGQTVEQQTISFPPGGPNTSVQVTFNVESTLKVGSAVSITLTQTFPVFLVCTAAELSAPGQVTADFFNVTGLAGPGNTDLQGHVTIAAHDRSQLG